MLRSTPWGRIGFELRQLALGDAIGPVPEVLERGVAQRREQRHHLRPGLPRLHAAEPRTLRRLDGGEGRREGTRGLLSELVTPDAAVVLDGVQPLGLRDVLRDVAALPAELIRARNVEHRVPVDRRIVVRGGSGVRRRLGRDVDELARLRRGLRAVDKPISPRPHAVLRFGQIRHNIAPTIVGDDALDVSHLEVAGLCDHPNARLGAVGPGHDATNVIVVDGNGLRLLRV